MAKWYPDLIPTNAPSKLARCYESVLKLFRHSRNLISEAEFLFDDFRPNRPSRQFNREIEEWIETNQQTDLLFDKAFEELGAVITDLAAVHDKTIAGPTGHFYLCWHEFAYDYSFEIERCLNRIFSKYRPSNTKSESSWFAVANTKHLVKNIVATPPDLSGFKVLELDSPLIHRQLERELEREVILAWKTLQGQQADDNRSVRDRPNSAARPAELLATRKQLVIDEMLETINYARPASSRNRLWLKWNHEDQMTPAKIRDRWNGMPDEHRQKVSRRKWRKVPPKQVGADIVKKGLLAAEREISGGKTQISPLFPV